MEREIRHPMLQARFGECLPRREQRGFEMEEVEYLRAGDALVTSTRIEIGGQTFAVRNVGSVKVMTPGTPWLPIVVAVIGVYLAVQSSTDSNVVGIALMAAGGLWAWWRVRERKLVIVSGGGEVVALSSTDTTAVENLRAAIAQAISSR